jgi:hypothetical protein
LVFNFLEFFGDLNFHMTKLKLWSPREEVVLENLMEMCRSNDFGGTLTVQQILEYPTGEPNTVYSSQ